MFSKLNEKVIEIKEKRRRKKEIAKNKYDFDKVKHIAKTKAFLEENFLDENYDALVKYALDFKEKLDDHCLCDFYFDITPLELKMLDGREAFSKAILREFDWGTQYAIVPSRVLSIILRTRKYPNRQKAFELLFNYSVTSCFEINAFEDAFIEGTEKYITKLSTFSENGIEIDDDAFLFPPEKYGYIASKFDEIYCVITQKRYDYVGEPYEEDVAILTPYGKQLLKECDNLCL